MTEFETVRTLEGHNGVRLEYFRQEVVDGIRSSPGNGYNRHMFQVVPDRCDVNARGDNHDDCLSGFDSFRYRADYIVDEYRWLKHGYISKVKSDTTKAQAED